MTAQVAADLRAAADVLRRDGWMQGDYTDVTSGRHCAVGAIEVATAYRRDTKFETWARREAAVDALEETAATGTTVFEWNDAPGRTAAEVIAALEAAADAAEIKAAYDEGRWCGECQYGVVNDPPCCTQGPVNP